MTLRQKISLIVTAIMLSFLIVIFGLIYYSFQRVTIDQEMDRIESQASVIREALASDAALEVNPGQLLRAYLPTEGMIRVIDEEHTAIQIITRETELTLVEPIFSSGQQIEQINHDELGRIARLSFPLIWTDGQVVSLEVIERIDQVDEMMDILMYVLIFALIFMIIPIWLAGRGISQIIFKPIKRLADVMATNQMDGEWQLIELDSNMNDEISQLSATYNEMNERIRENFLKQKQFVSNASHELKTPIAIIKSYAQLIQRQGKVNPEVIEESVEAIDFETDRMTQLIQQMLMLATLDRGDALTYQTVDLVKLARDSVRSISTAFNRKIQFETSVTEVEASVDAEKINQVLYILLDNARKYSDDLIQLSIEQTDDQVIISVIDRGDGISGYDQEKIFDRLYRIDQGRSRETGGAGLGLSIAKEIVLAHGGKLSLTSEQGKGSTFSIMIPN